MTILNDPTLDSIIKKLKKDYHCHTVILYGSRARGLTTATSDYDVIGVSRRGPKTRIAKKLKGEFWDVFVYSEKDLHKLTDQNLSWKNARVLYEEGRYGRDLVARIQKILKKPYPLQPQYEIDAAKAWAQKELDRCRAGDIQGLYRRAEFQTALIEHYFFVRQKRFWGPKESFAWVKKHDPKTFKLIGRTLKFPTNLSFLKAAATRVYKVSLE
jgi:uncharacterized protein